MSGKLTEHPSAVLRREVDELKLRVRLLESQAETTTRAILVVVQKHEEMRDLLIRTLTVVNKIEQDQSPK